MSDLKSELDGWGKAIAEEGKGWGKALGDVVFGSGSKYKKVGETKDGQDLLVKKK